MRAAFVSGVAHSVTGLSSSASALSKPQLLLHSLSSRRPLVVFTSSSPRRGSPRFPRMLLSSFSPPAQSASTKDSVPGLAEQPDTLRSLAEYGRRVLCSPDPAEKIRLTNAAAKFWASPDTRAIGAPLGSAVVPATPARPELPRIVGSGEMPTAKDAVASGFSRPVYLLHALAHVELNAIDLAWDTALRFGEGMNETWFDDFLSIAVDESRHFGWLSARLEALGSSYGAMPAHRIVWDAADCSKTSRKERLAVGQLCQEARGLDAGPKLAERLTGMGDLESAAIVKKIAEEEVAHVSIGVRQFVDECGRDLGVSRDGAVAVFHEIALRLSNPGAFAPPFNAARRLEAGLDASWYIPVAEEMQETVKMRHKASPGVQAQVVNVSAST